MITPADEIDAAAEARRVTSPGAAGGVYLLLIILAILVAYANSFAGVWVFDDYPYILENTDLRQLWPPNYLWTNTRPLLHLTFAVNFALGGDDIWGFHALSLLIHITAALALFGILRRTLQALRMQTHFGLAAAPLAFVVTLAWALHPVQTMAITNIWQRGESLMAMFSLLTLYCFLRSDAPDAPRGWLAATIVMYWCSVASKEVAAMLPLVIVLYDWTFLANGVRQMVRKRWAVYVGFAAGWCLLAYLIAYQAQSFHNEDNIGFASKIYTPVEYLATAPGVLWQYLQISLWPRPLCFWYAWPIVDVWQDSLVAMLGVGLILLVAGWGVRKRAAWAVGGLAIFLFLAPTTSFMPTPYAIFEYRLYLPLAAFLPVLICGIYVLVSRFVKRSVVLRRIANVGLLVFAIVGVLTLGTLTWERNQVYHSGLALWLNTVTTPGGDVNPGVWRNLGKEHMARQEFALAEICHRNALRLHLALVEQARKSPRHQGEQLVVDNSKYYYNIGAALFEQNRYSEALHHFSVAVNTQPEFVEARFALAMCLVLLDRRAEAEPHFDILKQQVPDLPALQPWLKSSSPSPESRENSGRQK